MKKALTLLWLAFGMVGLSSQAQTQFNAQFTFLNQQGQPNTNCPVFMTPLAPFTGYNGAYLTPQPVAQITDSNGLVTFTNEISGYVYLTAISTPWGVTVYTNGFPAGLTGTVNGFLYNGILTNQVFYYSGLATNQVQGAGSVTVTYNGGVYYVSAGASGLSSNLPPGQIYVGNALSNAAARTPAFDITMDTNGNFTLANGNGPLSHIGAQPTNSTLTQLEGGNGSSLAGTTATTLLAGNTAVSALSGTVAIAHGGTGQTTAPAALSALGGVAAQGGTVSYNSNGPAFTIHPYLTYHTNVALTGLAGSNYLSGPPGTFSTWNEGDNIVLAGNDQVAVVTIINSSTCFVTPQFASSHVAETNGVYYPTAMIGTDINGNPGFTFDSGGNAQFHDATSSGGIDPLILGMAGGATNSFGMGISSGSSWLGPYTFHLDSLASVNGQNSKNIIQISSSATFNAAAIGADNYTSLAGLTNAFAATIPCGVPIDMTALKFHNISGSPTITNGTGNGSGSVSLDPNSDDTVQIINLTIGSGISANSQIATVWFANPKTSTNRTVILSPMNANDGLALTHGWEVFFTTNYTTSNYQIWDGPTAPTTGDLFKLGATGIQ